MDTGDVQKEVTYTSERASLTAAWEFIMEHVDEFAHPSIMVTPYINVIEEEDEPPRAQRLFKCCVAGVTITNKQGETKEMILEITDQFEDAVIEEDE